MAAFQNDRKELTETEERVYFILEIDGKGSTDKTCSGEKIKDVQKTLTFGSPEEDVCKVAEHYHWLLEI